jgi:hypothetical protein
MFMSNQPFPIWTIWRNLGFLEHLFFMALFMVSVYCLFAAVKILLRVRSTLRLNPDQDRASIQRSLGVSRKLLTNVQQTLGAAFYLFGCVLFMSLANIGNVNANSKIPIDYYILQNFLLRCAFAANAFFAFLVLHLIQWFVSRQLNSCAEHLKAS